MTLKRYFISAALLLVSFRGLCCGPNYYAPQEYYMYRSYNAKDERLSNSRYLQNCKAWQDITSKDIPIEDIREVVYKYDIDKISRLMTDVGDSNEFAAWIRKNNDVEVQRFLRLAKSCEKVRFMKSSRWYYPSKEDDILLNLGAIRDKALEYAGERLRDRYALQALRAMHSLGEFADIDKWWDENGNRIMSGVIREMAEEYVAGAISRLGNTDKAMKMAAMSNDIGAIKGAMRYMGQDTDDKSVLDFIATHCPDNPNAPAFLQEIFYGAENKYEWSGIGEYVIVDPDFGKFVEPCIKAVRSPLCKKPAVWYYTAAYIEDMQGKTKDAYGYVKLAENSEGTPFIKESVKLMRVYLDAKMLRYDGSDDDKLLAGLKWMDDMICSNMTPEVREDTEELYFHYNYSYYYWGDMMRRVVLGEMVPRMKMAGRGRTAIALANMADNRMLCLVDRCAAVSKYNCHDYDDDFFKLMDTVGIHHLERYVATVGRAKSVIDKFLDARGYIDIDYLNEILGTRYLRAQDYVNAVGALSKVSPSYQYRTNLVPYMNRLPFVFLPTRSAVAPDYKLSFARQMLQYRNESMSSDPDKAGLAMVMMGIGLRSSFGFCWALTQYHLYTDDDWLTDGNTKLALSEAERLMNAGRKMILDRELAARICVMLCQWKHAVTHYPETRTADMVRTQCDTYRDY